MTPRTRTTLGLALFAPLAAILLTTLACLPAPVGDPDQSTIDAKLTGAWQAKDGPNDDVILALIRPWDKHTYYLQYMVNEKKDGKDNWNVLHHKAWLTKIGDATFITAEPLDLLDYAFAVDDPKKYWVVGRVEIKNNAVTFRMIKEDSWIVKELKTREKLEAAIKAQVDNDELYSDAKTFKKLTKEDANIVEDALKAANIGLNPGK
jgi:hypothetical protein